MWWRRENEEALSFAALSNQNFREPKWRQNKEMFGLSVNPEGNFSSLEFTFQILPKRALTIVFAKIEVGSLGIKIDFHLPPTIILLRHVYFLVYFHWPLIFDNTVLTFLLLLFAILFNFIINLFHHFHSVPKLSALCFSILTHTGILHDFPILITLFIILFTWLLF